jgi:hypothetical protein
LIFGAAQFVLEAMERAGFRVAVRTLEIALIR